MKKIKIKKININLNKVLPDDINLIIEYLHQGKIIAYPTDTVYGLGCLAVNKKAINKIFKIKHCEPKPLLILVKSINMLKKYCFIAANQENYLRKIWPGPITVILRGKGILPAVIAGRDNSIAARLPKSDFLTTILTRVNKPLISTSLNISSRRIINNLKNINQYFTNYQPDLAIDAGPVKNIKASKIIDIINLNNIKIIRN